MLPVKRPTAAHSVCRDRFAPYQGIRIHYTDSGEGSTAVVFIHGWSCNAEFWKNSVHQFPQYRVLAIDLPGHGSSGKPVCHYSLEYLANAIEAVLRDAGVRNVMLVGHSFGTRVIRKFGELHPARTLGLVVVDGIGQTMTKKEVEYALAPLLINYSENIATFLDAGMLAAVKQESLRQEIRAQMLATPDHVGFSIIAAEAVETMLNDRNPTSAPFQAPVLAILAQSPWWNEGTERALRAIAPQLEFEIWTGVSHFLMMEKPETFNERLHAFIAKNKLIPHSASA